MLSTTDLDLLRRRFDNDAFAQSLSNSENDSINGDLFVKVIALGPDLEDPNDERRMDLEKIDKRKYYHLWRVNALALVILRRL
jgi:hypothetical protein